MFDLPKRLRLGAKQFDGETHGFRPIAPNETPYHRVPFEAAEQVFPDAGKSQMGLPHIEDDSFISKELKIQAFPRGRTLVDEQESLQGDGDMFTGHRAYRKQVGVIHKGPSTISAD